MQVCVVLLFLVNFARIGTLAGPVIDGPSGRNVAARQPKTYSVAEHDGPVDRKNQRRRAKVREVGFDP